MLEVSFANDARFAVRGGDLVRARVLDGGVPYDDALDEAMTVGLKLTACDEKARVSIHRQNK